MVKVRFNIPERDPLKNDKIWKISLASNAFSSGSNLDESDYLRLRTLWYTWRDVNLFSGYMRDNPALTKGESQAPTPYTGYITKSNDELANKIYNDLKHTWKGYLDDIQAGLNLDPTRPSINCGLYLTTRYWQGLVLSKTKESHTEQEVSMSCQVRKGGTDSVAAVTSAMANSSISGPPATPQTPQRPSRASYGTPKVPSSAPMAGGKQNPATTDETYVNTAALLLLQMVTLSVGKSTTASRDFPLGDLDWLADRLPLKMYQRSPTNAPSGSKGNPTAPVELMEARVDGYLCKRGYRQPTDPKKPAGTQPRFNALPLAILETKPFARSSGLSHIRWQESAEMACWVSGLDDTYEGIGLLQSSTSGRKRRLLLSQDRSELYIIIAEYGQQWKDYIRGNPPARPTDQSQDVVDLAGSEGFVQNAKDVAKEQFARNIGRASRFTSPQPGNVKSTRSSAGAHPEFAGPEYFCIMQQWGPFRTDNAHHMDLFLRRLIALQLQLLTNWPAERFGRGG